MIERGKPVVDRDKSHEQGQEIQKQNSGSELVRTLLDRQREQILADCHHDRRSIQKLNETIESQQEELHRAQSEERRTVIEAKLGSS